MKRPTLLLALWLCASARAAEPLTAEQVARVRLAEAAALAKVDAAHGHRLPSQMSLEERRQVIDEQAAASREALAAEGVDAKRYARHTARMSRQQVAEVAAALRQLEAARAAPPPRPAPRGEILVEYGTPVSLEPPREGPEAIEVEYGTPIPLPPEPDAPGPAELPAGK